MVPISRTTPEIRADRAMAGYSGITLRISFAICTSPPTNTGAEGVLRESAATGLGGGGIATTFGMNVPRAAVLPPNPPGVAIVGGASLDMSTDESGTTGLLVRSQ